ncbi:MAG: hydroxymethylbilane synthase [Candidatus Omnitrophica bacterium]|nr:hydroxymethylbilane synthase [Candidatus Omnitrophota bacterium]
MKRVLKLGSRPSPLALRQAAEISRLFPHAEFQVKTYLTLGDKDRITPLSDVEGLDFFTRELDEALLRDEIDLAVHSSKDLPEVTPCGLNVVFQTPSIAPNDCFISRVNLPLSGISKNSRIGTSSIRRKEQLRKIRPDLLIVDVRGNVQERLALMDAGKFDGLIVAHAALIRLGLEHRITEVLNLNDFPTHPRQGSLSLVAKRERWQEVKSILLEQGPGTGN